MREVIVLSHKRTVGSGKVLADALGARCITPKNTKRIPPDALLINYGVSAPLSFVASHPVVNTMNTSVSVGRAVNKVACYERLESVGVSVPEYTTDPWGTDSWFLHGHTSRRRVFARRLVSSSRGRGISLFESHDELLKAHNKRPFKLFTRNVPKTKEFRVHVINGNAVHVSQKRAMSLEKREEAGIGPVNNAVRSYSNGWVFANELAVSDHDRERIATVGEQAVDNLGLSFGAVDVLCTGPGKEVRDIVVCEVNTAPSLDGYTTLTSYVQAIEEIAHEN